MAKTLLIFSALFILTSIIIAMYCALVIANRFDERTDEQIEKDMKKLLTKKQLCLKCKICKESYEPDKYSKPCPYINRQNGAKCDFFVSADTLSDEVEFKKDIDNEQLPPENFNVTL